MRRLASALFLLLLPAFAAATTVSTDFTDMWWVPDESGWGANVVQQGDTLFVTVFVYDGQQNPTWFVAPNTAFKGGTKFSGPLYSTSGPYFAGRFDPSRVATNQLGTLTFEGGVSASTATLVYAVGGIVVTKQVTRQTWRTDNLAGLYLGSRQGTWSGCDPALNGRVDSFAQIGISQNGNDVVFRDAGNRYTCTYGGKVGPAGRFSEIVGEGICDDHVARFLRATEVQVSQIGFSMRYYMLTVSSECHFDGYLGGIRQLP